MNVLRDFTRENASSAMAAHMEKTGKGVPVIREKSRALGVSNFIKNGEKQKLEAAERQRANADRLTKGYSVVKSSSNKENVNVRESMAVGPRLPTLRPRNSILRPAETKNNVMKPPVRPIKQKKPQNTEPARPALQKCESLLQLPSINVKASEPDAKASEQVPTIMVDIDDSPEHAELFLGMYAKDIYKYLKVLENRFGVREKYLTSKHLMNEDMRAVLVDWLFEVQQFFTLLQETTQMAIAMLDRFIQESPKVPKDELQLAGVTCVFIACKFEEMYSPDINDFIVVSANAFTKQQIMSMERRILKTLNYDVSRPTPVLFLRRYCRVAECDSLVYNYSKYFMDSSLIHYSFCHVPPSLLAAGCLCLALFINSDAKELTKDLWELRLQFYSEYTFSDIEAIVLQLAKMVVKAPKSKQKTVLEAYSRSKRLMNVSVRPELSSAKLIALAATSVKTN